MIIAAKNGKGKFEWIIPLLFFGFYIFSALTKGKAQKEYDDKLDAKLDEIDKEPMPESDQPKTVYIKPPKEILQKKLRAQQALAAQIQQRKAAKPKPAPRKTAKPRELTRAAMRLNDKQHEAKPKDLEILPEVSESMIEEIHQPQTIRDAIVMAEIIGKPRSINQWQY